MATKLVDTAQWDPTSRVHVYPVNEEDLHDLESETCWCKPEVEKGVVIHHQQRVH